MYSQVWTKHLEAQEEKDRFYQAVMAAKPVLDRLHELADEKLKSLDLREMSTESYQDTNWAFKQAHQNGFKQALTSFKQIINLDQKKETNDPKQYVRI